ncbi:class III extradiol dioxygenase subunit B-like domain-containing protein [Marinactinospora thermotolerans]|uniref:class III extradiol dioxygenase subunit B-like domain-containing protein n=1 Tax=Marinactinospora thermotolerans TaxID=531310 RepID=UPI003D92D8AB
MLIAAAVCPHPPLLVPEVAQGAAGELDTVRAACDRAVAGLLEAGADRIVVVGAGTATGWHGPEAGGDLTAYGVGVRTGGVPAVLPLSLTLGRWLAERAGATPDAYAEIAGDAGPQECREMGRRLAAQAPRVAALVMGDGSARRDTTSPGYLDERARRYDTEVADALARADTRALAGLDPEPARELLVAGRPAWQVLAEAARGTGLVGELLAHEAPYGVGYFVASWSR